METKSNRLIIKTLCALATVAVMIGCEKQKPTPQEPSKGELREFAIEVGSEAQQVGVRTVLDGKDVKWVAGDKMSVLSSEFHTAPQEFTAVGEGVSTTFKGTLDDRAGSIVAIYPHSSALRLTGSAVAGVELPAEQPFVGNATFAPAINPMLGRGEVTDKSLAMKNLCGVARFALRGSISVKSIAFEVDVPVAGKAEIKDVADPKLTFAEGSSTKVTLAKIDQQLDKTEKTYMIVLPAGEYLTFTITVTDAEGKVYTKKSTKPITIKRAVITNVAAYYVGQPSVGNEGFTEEDWSWN